MPTTVLLQQHEPRVHTGVKGVSLLDEYLAQCCPREYRDADGRICAEGRIHASSITTTDLDSQSIHPSSSSLVRSAIEAWGQHSHLVLRPDDFWAQILVQLNFYMTKNAESLRDLFVSHSGKENLMVANETSWQDILARFQIELQKRIKTPWLSEWIQGGFTTSTPTDELSNIVLMMGLMSTFFTYRDENICGIPSITLLGTKLDWQRLLEKIERLKDFGEEPKAYSERLRPILTCMVSTFDNPSTVGTRDFWDQMIHAKVKHDNLCGKPPLQYTVSGWLLGLFYWNRSGSVSKQFAEGLGHTGKPGSLKFDNVRYGEAFLEDLPVGYAKVRCVSLERGEQDRWLLAGNVARRIVSGAPEGYTTALARDDQSSSSSTISDEKGAIKATGEKASSFSQMLCGLSCFGGASSGRQRQKALVPKASRETMARPVSTKSAERKLGHSTIQPLAAWFLFSAKEQIRYDWAGEEEETYGPTVDAVNSCRSVEHYLMKYS